MRQVLVIVFAGFLALPLAAQETGATVEPEAEPVMAETVSAESEAESEAAPDVTPLNATDVSLADFQWLKRPIVIFADTPADPRYQEQLKLLLERPEELLERDVVLIVDTDPRGGSGIRKKLRPRGFMLTLIGKDGGVKLRKPFPWDVREITHAIDKWPLRKQEIRDAKAAAASAGSEE